MQKKFTLILLLGLLLSSYAISGNSSEATQTEIETSEIASSGQETGFETEKTIDDTETTSELPSPIEEETSDQSIAIE